MESTDVRDELDYILQPDITQQEGFPEKSESESIILFFLLFFKIIFPFHQFLPKPGISHFLI